MTAMGNHDRSRPPRWLGILLMASLAVAQSAQATSGLTLSNFQLITSTGVPLACILTYNTVLPSCQTSDFTSGNTCSRECANGIRTVQRAILTACDQVPAAGNSVLGQALAGNLVELLCPSSGTPPLTSSKKTLTASTATTFSTVPTTLSQVTLTTFTSSTATPSRTEIMATDIPTYSPPPGPPGPPGPLPPAPTETTGAQQPIKPPQPTADIVLGGGSPFDAFTSSGSSYLTLNSIPACLVVLALSLQFVR